MASKLANRYVLRAAGERGAPSVTRAELNVALEVADDTGVHPLLTGAAAIPGVSVSQQPPESSRVVRPAGNGPHPAILFVSGCSGFTRKRQRPRERK
jgi:hypothetical protein